ncbi:hypothetical protein F4680DRAFT_452104 [Xylaria scruposa]|nr:hypothetical protein F4680DRAFT_452104 [Xylaria scruposa]
MSSTPDNQPDNGPAYQPRVCDYIEGERLTKAEFLEFMTSRGTYDNDSVEVLLEFIEQHIPTHQKVKMPHFERLRKLHLADGRISNEQNEILKTVQKKLHATIENTHDALFELRRFLHDEPASEITEQLHDEMKRKAISFLEQTSTQRAHEEWMENFACADPLNISDMIQDAQEFPLIPWNVEPAPWNLERDLKPDEQPAQPTTVSSAPPDQPRVYIDYDDDYEREELTKAEFIEFYDDVKWEYFSASDMILELELIVADLQLESDLVPHFERFRGRHLANGEISNEQDEILVTVVEKLQGWAEVASTVLLSLKARPAHEPIATLHDEIKYKAVHFLEQNNKMMEYVEWLEYIARAYPQDITAMIEDAREFPNPPWQPEEAEQDGPVGQAEQGEQIE